MEPGLLCGMGGAGSVGLELRETIGAVLRSSVGAFGGLSNQRRCFWRTQFEMGRRTDDFLQGGINSPSLAHQENPISP